MLRVFCRASPLNTQGESCSRLAVSWRICSAIRPQWQYGGLLKWGIPKTHGFQHVSILKWSNTWGYPIFEKPTYNSITESWRFFSSSSGPESSYVQLRRWGHDPALLFGSELYGLAIHGGVLELEMASSWNGDAPAVGESPGVDRGTEDSYLERVFLVCKGAAGLNFENNNVQYVYIELYIYNILSIHM